MPNSLILDAREASRPGRTGKGQWAYGFIRELLRRDLSVTLLTDSPVPSDWDAAKAIVEQLPAGKSYHLAALRILRAHPGSTFVSPTSYIVPSLAPRSVRVIPIIHDLIAFHGELHDRKAVLIERWTLPRLLRRAKRACTISDATKTDLLSRFPRLDAKSITPIFAGPMHQNAQPRKPDERTILCIGTLCPRKNQLRLIRAFATLPKDLRDKYRLVLAGGRGWHDEEIVREAAEVPGVEWIGYVDDAEYLELLTTCTVFALPSLYEGFGMQILDALQHGVPVLTSDRGSLKELVAGAAEIVDPESVTSIAAGLERLLRDEPARSDFSVKGKERASAFSWSKTVDRFLACL